MKVIFKLIVAAILIPTAMAAQATFKIIDNESGDLSIGGDIELNFNYQDRESNDSGHEEFNQDGRVLIEFAGKKVTGDGHYIAFNAQPLFETTGNIALDDAYFEFGAEDAWAIKMGRFEAYDMFPVGLDVFLEYSGDTSNELYMDGSPYSYQMKEGRGRGSDGQIMYHQEFGNFYVEIGSMIGDRSSLFDGQKYHGEIIDNSKDALLIRPVLAYQAGSISIAASLETNLVANAVVTSNGVDISDRTGYGLTGTWSNNKWEVNASVAYLDAVDEDNKSAGINTLWNNLGLGYIYSANEYKNSNFSGWAEGDVNVSTWYTSYEFANTLNVEGFSILLGAYYTSVDNKLTQQADNTAFSEDDDLGVRVRFFYKI